MQESTNLRMKFQPGKFNRKNIKYGLLPIIMWIFIVGSYGMETKEIINPDECTICTDNIKFEGHMNQLNCGHKFHKNCIEKWLEKEDTCPNCRKIVNFDKIEGLLKRIKQNMSAFKILKNFSTFLVLIMLLHYYLIRTTTMIFSLSFLQFQYAAGKFNMFIMFFLQFFFTYGVLVEPLFFKIKQLTEYLLRIEPENAELNHLARVRYPIYLNLFYLGNKAFLPTMTVILFSDVNVGLQLLFEMFYVLHYNGLFFSTKKILSTLDRQIQQIKTKNN